jgi:PEP-CTERM motif
MNVKLILAAALVMTMGNSARAVSLIVMGVNTAPGIAGAKVFTIGVRVTAADVAAGGPEPVLVVQNLTFTGGANGPIQQVGSANKPDVQSVQTSFIDQSAEFNSGPPSANLLTSAANNAFYRDSWWYNSPTGTLQGVVDSNGDLGTVTANPASDGSGIYTLGSGATGTRAVRTTGYTWTPAGDTGAAPANPTNGQTIAYSGLFGPAGADFLDPSPGGPFTDPKHILGDLLVANGGTLTVPLVQLVATGDILIPSQYAGGAGTFLEVGLPTYNVLGGPANVDPTTYLDFPHNQIAFPVPEPGTFVLAGLGIIGLILVTRRRK